MLGGFFAFNLSPLKPEEGRYFLFYVCAQPWEEHWRTVLLKSMAPPEAALRVVVGG